MTDDYSRDADVQIVLRVCIARRHFAGAALAQHDVDILRHCLIALADRAALVAAIYTPAVTDALDAARRHMRGE